MSNIVTLRSWAGKMKEYHFQPTKQANGSNWPFVKKVRYDERGNSEMILTAKDLEDPGYDYFIPEDMDIVVVDGTTFDLDDPMQKNLWDAIKTSDLIVPTRDSRDKNGTLLIDGGRERYGMAELWVDRPGEESEKSVSKKKLIIQAWNYIEKDSVNGRLTRCKLLGRDMNNSPASDIEDFLYKYAESKPQEVIELYTGSDMQLKLLLIDAKRSGKIVKDNGMWTFGDAILGATDEAVILFFKNPFNKKIVDQIKYVVYPEYAPVSVLEEMINKVTTVPEGITETSVYTAPEMETPSYEDIPEKAKTVTKKTKK